MSGINLYKEMNEKIADLLLECNDNNMLLYAGNYIKDLERQLAEYWVAEEQGNVMHLPVEPKAAVFSIEYCCSLNEHNKMGMCHKGFCSECADKKLYILETTAEASCRIKELGKSIFFSRENAEIALERMVAHA